MRVLWIFVILFVLLPASAFAQTVPGTYQLGTSNVLVHSTAFGQMDSTERVTIEKPYWNVPYDRWSSVEWSSYGSTNVTATIAVCGTTDAQEQLCSTTQPILAGSANGGNQYVENLNVGNVWLRLNQTSSGEVCVYIKSATSFAGVVALFDAPSECTSVVTNPTDPSNPPPDPCPVCCPTPPSAHDIADAILNAPVDPSMSVLTPPPLSSPTLPVSTIEPVPDHVPKDYTPTELPVPAELPSLPDLLSGMPAHSEPQPTSPVAAPIVIQPRDPVPIIVHVPSITSPSTERVPNAPSSPSNSSPSTPLSPSSSSVSQSREPNAVISPSSPLQPKNSGGSP